ncbi:hypothetical protein HNR44_000537 [Geomicrobium halophilum]|uniref:Uncharacterized protein n=1 Tax=Geomicrobium halophilum TaxID=549000 RepID=A0A841Q036_9BACL|nr:hypothetical protein [Geomicrobium halophilum]MBB6448588.1 hypothetical protein [Geomicrobium halophilum]
MFEQFFSAELANRLGASVEIATDNNLIEGILVSVSANLVLVIGSDDYGPGNRVFISVNSINFVRFPGEAAA